MDRADVAVIGAGPAGMAAAIYLHRAGVPLLLLERGARGGLLRDANLVENYPGFPGGIKGLDLVGRFSKQMDMLGIRTTKADVGQVRSVRGAFRIGSDAGDFLARAVVVATGTRPKGIALGGSERLVGTKVFDELARMPLTGLPGKRAIVVGGGDAAFDYGLNLQGRGCDVTIVSRSEPKCLSLLRARAEASGVDVLVGLVPELVRDAHEGVMLVCSRGPERFELSADFVLSACGREPNIDVLSPALRKRIGRPADIPKTKVPGLFLAGDVVRGKHRQTAIAVGDGTRAAMLVDEYLRRRGAGE